MFLINSFSQWDIFFVPTCTASLFTANKQDGRSTGIEGIKDSIRFPFMLDSQLPYCAELGPFDIRTVGVRQMRPLFFQ